MFDLASLNWLAVLVAGAVSFVLGGAWYVVLSSAWMAELGLTREQIEASGGGARMYAGYAGAAATYLLAALALALIAQLAGTDTALEGLVFGLLGGIGLVATTQANTYAFGQRSLRLYLIDVGYTVLALAITGIILGVWR